MTTKVQIKSIFTEAFLSNLSNKPVAIMKAMISDLVSESGIKDADKAKINLILHTMKSADRVLMYAYNLKLKYEGMGVV